MTAKGNERSLLLVVFSSLARCEQYALYDELSLTIEASRGVIVPYIDSLFILYTVAQNAPSLLVFLSA